MIKYTQCTGEGQGSCKMCEDMGKWNRAWMSFLYKIDGTNGCFCGDCIRKINEIRSNGYKELRKALEIAIECDLNTIAEAIRNIEIHATQIFSYSEMEEKLKQLHYEVSDIVNRTTYTLNDDCSGLLAWIDITDDGVDVKDLPL